MKANDKQIGGNHYKMKIEPWDYIIENGIGYLEGNVIKYISRYKGKHGVEDLQKARHYLDKLIETVSENEPKRDTRTSKKGRIRVLRNSRK